MWNYGTTSVSRTDAARAVHVVYCRPPVNYYLIHRNRLTPSEAVRRADFQPLSDDAEVKPRFTTNALSPVHSESALAGYFGRVAATRRLVLVSREESISRAESRPSQRTPLFGGGEFAIDCTKLAVRSVAGTGVVGQPNLSKCLIQNRPILQSRFADLLA
jgi:hypothetical protein